MSVGCRRIECLSECLRISNSLAQCSRNKTAATRETRTHHISQPRPPALQVFHCHGGFRLEEQFYHLHLAVARCEMQRGVASGQRQLQEISLWCTPKWRLKTARNAKVRDRPKSLRSCTSKAPSEATNILKIRVLRCSDYCCFNLMIPCVSSNSLHVVVDLNYFILETVFFSPLQLIKPTKSTILSASFCI